MKKYGLAIHTTSPELGLALADFNGDTRSNNWNLGLDLSAYLHQYLSEFIAPQTWQDLEFIAVAKGPGSFTATRIGMVTARTLAQQLNIPLFAISSLKAFAWREKDSDRLIAVQMEARRNQIFVAIYEPFQAGLKDYLVDTTMNLETWQQTLNSLKTKYKLIETPTNLGHTAESLLELAYFDRKLGNNPDWFQALPFYGQKPV